jgi:diguanylate cyclase (GGDEF)-like protein
MYRQLFSAIILSSLLALFSSVVSSTLSTRAYLVEQLTVKNQDNATALALSLSQTLDDPIKVELAVAAQFDSGNYKLVRFTDALGNVKIEKSVKAAHYKIPAWFVALLPLEVPAGNAKVSSGWVQLGTVTLESRSAYAYESLWRSAVQMTMSMCIAAFLACYFGYLILRRIKRPLDLVVDQANAISEKRFITIPEPSVPELRKLALAMNFTVRRLKEMFAEEAKRLDLLRREANYDHLTGLPNRDSFMTQLRASLDSEDSAFGACLILRISNLAGINRQHGRAIADEVIKRAAKQVQLYSEKMQDSLVGRLNGSDFALLVPSDDPQGVAKSLIADVVTEISEYFESESCASIGIATYYNGIALGTLMSQIDIALAAAEAKGNNDAEISAPTDDLATPTTLDGWANVIRNAIRLGNTYLLSFPVGNFDGSILHREGPLRIRESAQSAWIPAGQFFPVAERIGLNDALDLAAVALGLKSLAADKSLQGYAINLSASSLKVATFMPALKKLIHSHAEDAKRLWLELPEAGVFKNFDEFRELCLTLKSSGVKIGIEHFGWKFEQITLLCDIGVDYVKVDASFIRGIDSNAGKEKFLKGLAAIVHGIGVLVIAEGVLTEAEMTALQLAGFDGATGPAVKG